MSYLLAAAIAASAPAADDPCVDEPVPAAAASAPKRRAAVAPRPAASASSAPKGKPRPKIIARRIIPPCAPPIERAEPGDFTPAPEVALVLPEPATEPPAVFLPPPEVAVLPEAPECDCFAPSGFVQIVWPSSGGGYVVVRPPVVTPIPEPSALALLAAGLALMWRRRKQ